MRKSTKLKIFRRKKRSVILSVLKRHSLRQHTNGVTVKRTYRAGDAGTGVDNAAGRSCCGEITVFETHPLIQMDEYLDAEKNAVRVQDVWLEIGENTRGNIYTPQQQKHWLDQPEGKSGSINSVQKLQKIIKGYAAALEEKEKERAWLMEQ